MTKTLTDNLLTSSYATETDQSVVQEPTSSNTLFGKLAILISGLAFASSSIAVKTLDSQLLPHAYNGVFIACTRFIIGLLLCVLFLAGTLGYQQLLKTRTPENSPFAISDQKYLIYRGLFGSLSMTLIFVAIQITSSGRATLIAGAYPIYVALCGWLLFKEKINLIQMANISLIVFGLYFVFYDQSQYAALGDLTALGAGLCVGLSFHYMKKAREKNTPTIIYLYVCILGILLTIIPTLYFGKILLTQLSFSVVSLFLLIGLINFIGNQLMAYGFKYVKATTGSIISCSEIVFSVILSHLYINEVITTRFLIGLSIIMTGLILGATELPQLNLLAQKAYKLWQKTWGALSPS